MLTTIIVWGTGYFGECVYEKNIATKTKIKIKYILIFVCKQIWSISNVRSYNYYKFGTVFAQCRQRWGPKILKKNEEMKWHKIYVKSVNISSNITIWKQTINLSAVYKCS